MVMGESGASPLMVLARSKVSAGPVSIERMLLKAPEEGGGTEPDGPGSVLIPISSLGV